MPQLPSFNSLVSRVGELFQINSQRDRDLSVAHRVHVVVDEATQQVAVDEIEIVITPEGTFLVLDEKCHRHEVGTRFQPTFRPLGEICQTPNSKPISRLTHKCLHYPHIRVYSGDLIKTVHVQSGKFVWFRADTLGEFVQWEKDRRVL